MQSKSIFANLFVRLLAIEPAKSEIRNTANFNTLCVRIFINYNTYKQRGQWLTWRRCIRLSVSDRNRRIVVLFRFAEGSH